MDCSRVATTGGLVDALLELEHPPLDGFPGEGVPFIHRPRRRNDRRGARRAHDVCTPTGTTTVHPLVPTSAYPWRYSGPWLLGQSCHPSRMWLAPAPRLTVPPRGHGAHDGGYSVPGVRLPWP